MSAADAEKSNGSLLKGEDGGESDRKYLNDYDLTTVVCDDFGNQILFWPEGYYDDDYVYEPASRKTSWGWSSGTRLEDSCEQPVWGDDTEGFEFYYHPAEEAEGAAEESPRESLQETKRIPSTSGRDGEIERRSLFVHSSPINFPDVRRARKSVFGSIFLRTSGHQEELALLRSMAESNYNMLQSLLNSLDRILSEPSSEAERKRLTLAYRNSVLKVLESHGITKTHSDGSVHWDIYPVTRCYLFSIEVGDHIHQTRNLFQIEERIVAGLVQTLRLPYGWPTESLWTGHWDVLGMAGLGSYLMPHGVSYNGKMQDGVFHDDNATLTYPNKFKALHCVYDKGRLLGCQFQFPDMLNHEKENWGYCQFPDRRFWSEVRNGWKNSAEPLRKIPPGCYDTSDGFYNPQTLMLCSPTGELLRVPVCEEDRWIKKYCRKGFYQMSDFRPDLFDNWYNYDQEFIQTILDAQKNFRAGKITHDELQQIYADLDLLPSWSKFKKRRTSSEIAFEEYWKSIPEPRVLKPPKVVEKFAGLNILEDARQTDERKRSSGSLQTAEGKLSKHSAGLQTSSHRGILSGKYLKTGDISRGTMSFAQGPQRVIPETYLAWRPLLKPPFEGKGERASDVPRRGKKKCRSRDSLGSWDGSKFGEDRLEAESSKTAVAKFMKKIIMERVNDVLVAEREKHRRRLFWGKKASGSLGSQKENKRQTCGRFVVSDTQDEYCDSDHSKTCDLTKLSVDKYDIIRFWGTKIYQVEFEGQAR